MIFLAVLQGPEYRIEGNRFQRGYNLFGLRTFGRTQRRSQRHQRRMRDRRIGIDFRVLHLQADIGDEFLGDYLVGQLWMEDTGFVRKAERFEGRDAFPEYRVIEQMRLGRMPGVKQFRI